MAKMNNMGSIVDRTRNNQDLEAFKQAFMDAETFKERLERVGANKGKFSEKVFLRVFKEYKDQYEEASRKIDPFREKLARELREFENKLKEVAVLSTALQEDYEELALRNIAGELSDVDFEKRKSELEPQLGELKTVQGILGTNIDHYHRVLEMKADDDFAEAPTATSATEDTDDAPSASGPVSGSSDDLEDWHDLPDAALTDNDDSGTFNEADSAEGPVYGESDLSDDGLDVASLDEAESVAEPSYDEQESFPEEETGADREVADFDQTVNEDFNLDLPAELREELIEPEESTPAEGYADHAIPCLVVLEGDTEQSEFHITSDVITIGRGPDNDIQLANDTSVSRHHSRITLENSEYIVTDLDSSNGTYVNGERVTQIALSENDEISIGQTIMLFKRNP